MDAGGTGGDAPDCKCGGTTPLCNQATLECSECTDDDSCAAEFPTRPICLNDGSCVECDDDVHCPASAPVCDDNACRSCSAHAECLSFACGRTEGTCVPEAEIVYLNLGASVPSCGTRGVPCGPPSDAMPLLSASRPYLVLVPGTSSSNVEPFVLPAVAGLTLVGHGSQLATYNGSPVITVNADATLDGFRLLQGLMGAAEADGIRCNAGTLTVVDSTVSNRTFGIDSGPCATLVRDSRLENNDVGVYADSLSAFRVERNVFRANTQALYSVGNPIVIQNNLFLDNGAVDYLSIVNIPVTVGSPFFGFNTMVGNFHNCAGFGLVACRGTATPTITSNIFWDNFPGQDDSCLDQQFYSCNGTTDNILQRLVTGDGNVVDDPLFANPDSGDYSLTQDSPAVNQASVNDAPDEDLLGTPRPQGSGPDIGAYEFVP
jgi:hypothetical protein